MVDPIVSVTVAELEMKFGDHMNAIDKGEILRVADDTKGRAFIIMSKHDYIAMRRAAEAPRPRTKTKA